MNQEQSKESFWTAGRLAMMAFVFALSALIISNCKSNDTANLAANGSGQPKVTITTQRGAQPPQPPQTQRTTLQTVPATVWNTEIQGVDGSSFHLSDYKDKVVVLDLWATWCGPCRMEIPHLVDLNKEYAGKGVEVIGLTTESPQTDAEHVRDFAKEMNINYKLGWARGDMAMELMNGNTNIPQTFVIGPGGSILFHQTGYSGNLPVMIRNAIGRANGGSTSGD
ncbi:MAG TPA: TlpA disulfide reductase family protein [Pyrinomonadaceae bacterium]|nr:TlpA disulfide reductase family protein [Pyrinomonadaceae bacterium]